MRNGRRRMHGGLSTGPRTPEGRERCRKAATRHGGRSAAAVAERREATAMMRQLRLNLLDLEKYVKEQLDR